MNKILLSVFLVGILIITPNALAAVNTQYFGKTPSIIVSLTKQEPDPVEPGKQLEVSFKLDNNGTTANNVVFEILPEYPFSLLPEESPSKFIGTLGTYQEGKQSVIVKYKLKVAQDSSDDNHEIKVRYKSDNLESWVTLDNFRIKVQTHDSILAVEKFFTVPVVTAPGDKTKLRIELKNYATSILKDIKVSLNLDKSGDETRPFAPIGSTNEKVISYIEPQTSLPIDFELLVDSDAASKAYKIPLSVKYSDILNKNYSKTNLITIIVGDAPDLGVTLERTDVYTSGSTGSVVLRLVNKGAPDIKFLNVKVLQNENVKVIGADEVYIGKLDSDDFSTAEFKLFVKGKENVKIPVQVTYKDTNNNNYKSDKEVELRLYNSSEAKSFGVKKNNNFTLVVITAIIVGAGYYYYRKKKKK
ncbi:LPXTG cell wall anchor domain-containing protein [Candidatus Woesearchaeota archaeon]|nr:LPXTG cell wall anchor domain-containing protein [Candidatus Woesearchaeota archaeon]